MVIWSKVSDDKWGTEKAMVRMGRPPLWRRVDFIPQVTYFKPAGVPLKQLEESKLAIDELEAIRLKDYQDLDQGEAAQKMNISQPTFNRLLKSARKKIANALIKGQAIRIQGGNYKIIKRKRIIITKRKP